MKVENNKFEICASIRCGIEPRGYRFKDRSSIHLAGPTKHRKGATKDLLNTAKYDKEPNNPKLNPNLKSFVVFVMV